MRRDDDATRRCGRGDGAGESLQPSGALHSRCRSAVAAAPMVPLTVSPCSPQVPFTVASAPQPHGPPCSSSRDPRGWVRIAVEATTTRRSDDEAQRRRCGDDYDATTRRRRTCSDNDRARMVPSKCCHRNVATEMSLPSCAEAGHDDAATTRRRRQQPRPRCSPHVP